MTNPKPVDLTQYVTQMNDTEVIWNYILGGNATFTLVSKKTEQRYTFKVTKKEYTYGTKKGEDIHFVNVLTGPDNTNDYRYSGHIDYKMDFCRSKKSTGEPSPSHKAFAWFYSMLKSGYDARLLEQVEFWSSGRCCKCNRPLTVPESIQSGIGPVCATKA